jgi:caffeoyl-CoA O-methyltransferase
MDFIPQALADYSAAMSDAEPALLRELSVATHAKVKDPQMLSGHLVGRVLSMLSKLVQPQTIIEVGTFTGYSAICLAEGLVKGGTIHTLEFDDANGFFAAEWFQKAGITDRLELHLGPALDTLPRVLKGLSRPVDLAFLDAAKEEYRGYYDLIVPKLRPGGLIVTDNVLWSGKVVDKSVTDSTTEAIRAYTAYVAADERVEQVLLPIRDGILVARKR